MEAQDEAQTPPPEMQPRAEQIQAGQIQVEQPAVEQRQVDSLAALVVPAQLPQQPNPRAMPFNKSTLTS